MKNCDIFSKRILSICLGLSLVLLSASLFLFSIKTIQLSEAAPLKNANLPVELNRISHIAQPDSGLVITSDEEVKAIQAFGMGIREGVLYFGILYNNNTIGLHKADVNSEDILQW